MKKLLKKLDRLVATSYDNASGRRILGESGNTSRREPLRWYRCFWMGEYNSFPFKNLVPVRAAGNDRVLVVYRRPGDEEATGCPKLERPSLVATVFARRAASLGGGSVPVDIILSPTEEILGRLAAASPAPEQSVGGFGFLPHYRGRYSSMGSEHARADEEFDAFTRQLQKKYGA